MTPNNEPDTKEKVTRPMPSVLEARIDALRRDVGRLYKWVLTLVGSNVSLVITIILRMLFK